MDSNPSIGFLHAAYEELHRLEPLLQQNPIYRRVEALRRVIEEYERIVGSRGPDPTFGPDPAVTISVHEPTSDPTAKVSPSRPLVSANLTRPASANHPAADPDVSANALPARVPDPSISRRRSGWSWGNSQAARIRAAAVPYLRKKGKPATGPEIYRAISAKGVKVRGKKPAAVVCNTLRWASELFEHIPEKGFGLREWSKN